MARALTSALALIALALPASALGQGITVPPGQSEADQYFETVPDGRGGRSLDHGRPPGAVLTDRQLAELEELGEDGLAAAELASASAPVPEGEGSGSGVGDGGPGSGSRGAGGAGDGPTTADLTAASARDGLGWLLWVLLVACAAAVIAYALARRRDRMLS